MRIETSTILPIVTAQSWDDDFDNIKEPLMDWMDSYAREVEGNDRSNVHGYQSPDDFYLESDFAPFLNYMSPRILDLIEVYKNHELTDINTSYKISNMWFNINSPGSYNVYHSHPGCPLAGVLWVDIPDDSGEFIFHHPAEHNLSETQHSTWGLEPEDGMMMLFPGSFAHHVTQNMTEEFRYSIAFNLYDKF